MGAHRIASNLKRFALVLVLVLEIIILSRTKDEDQDDKNLFLKPRADLHENRIEFDEFHTLRCESNSRLICKICP